MAQDYYSDSNTSGDETSADTPAQDNSTDQTDTQDKGEEGETFLVSKSALGDTPPEPGDVCKFECVRNFEGESEFKYLPHDENKNDQSDNPDMQKSNDELSSMAT